MAAKQILFAVYVGFGCISLSLQKCFDNHCAPHASLSDCSQGTYLCQQNEYCEIVETHVTGSGFSNLLPYHIMICRPDTSMEDCLANYQQNDAECVPDAHDHACHWCCDTADCVHQLASGTYTPPSVS